MSESEIHFDLGPGGNEFNQFLNHSSAIVIQVECNWV